MNVSEKQDTIGQKYGDAIYSRNPSVPTPNVISKARRVLTGNERKGLLIDEGSGEIIGHGGAVSFVQEQVDKETFVKLYLKGVQQATGLTQTGLKVFGEVYSQLRDNPNTDTVSLNMRTTELSSGIFYRGLKELLQKEFLFRSPMDGTFFVNIQYMFNGNRLAFVQAYHTEDAAPIIKAPKSSLRLSRVGGH